MVELFVVVNGRSIYGWHIDARDPTIIMVPYGNRQHREDVLELLRPGVTVSINDKEEVVEYTTDYYDWRPLLEVAFVTAKPRQRKD